MHTLTIKQLPSSLYDSLKIRAERNHRSLNKEVIAILDETLSRGGVDPIRFLHETENLRSCTKNSLNNKLLRQYREKGRS